MYSQASGSHRLVLLFLCRQHGGTQTRAMGGCARGPWMWACRLPFCIAATALCNVALLWTEMWCTTECALSQWLNCICEFLSVECIIDTRSRHSATLQQRSTTVSQRSAIVQLWSYPRSAIVQLCSYPRHVDGLCGMHWQWGDLLPCGGAASSGDVAQQWYPFDRKSPCSTGSHYQPTGGVPKPL